MTEAGREELRRLERDWSQDAEKKGDCSKKSLRTSSRKIVNH